MRRRTFNLFILALMASALWQAYGPYVLHGPAIQAVVKNTVVVGPVEVASILKEHKQPTLLFTYASWCSNCKPLMRLLADKMMNHELDDVQLLMMSVDKEPYDMARYLVENHYDLAFTSYLFRQKSPKLSFADVMRLSGSAYDGGIPYIGLFNAKGWMVAEHSGDMSEDELALLLATLRNSQVPAR